MPILATFPKQPADVQDYDVDYADYLNELGGDTLVSAVVTADVGVTVDSHSIIGTAVKVWVSGGTTGRTYKVTIRATTAFGRVKEVEIRVKVKED